MKAVVLGSPLIRSYLVNYAKPLVYSSSLSMAATLAIKCALEHLEHADAVRPSLPDFLRCYLELDEATRPNRLGTRSRRFRGP